MPDKLRFRSVSQSARVANSAPDARSDVDEEQRSCRDHHGVQSGVQCERN